MDNMINIAKDFSPYAAGRYEKDGPYSGQKFRDSVLVPALRNGGTVTVDLDGTLGLGSSFLEETFGGLIRSAGFRYAELKEHLVVKCRIKTYENKVWQYMLDEDTKHRG